jgi:hypothetical protein
MYNRAGTSQPDPHRWRWRRVTGQGWVSWAATPPGALGEDGGVVLLSRADQVSLPCRACDRREIVWRATVGLPGPFPAAVDGHGGCTREHATEAVPTRWEDVAAVFDAAAAALRDDPLATIWHERLAHLPSLHAERAQWLSGQSGVVRHLAFRLWLDNRGLTLAATQAIVTGVLA